MIITKIFRITTYFTLISFFVAIMHNAFLKSKSMMLYFYLFRSGSDNVDLFFYYLLSYLFVIGINSLIVVSLSRFLQIRIPVIFSLIYLMFFIIMDQIYLYIITSTYLTNTIAWIFLIIVNLIPLIVVLFLRKKIIADNTIELAEDDEEDDDGEK